MRNIKFTFGLIVGMFAMCHSAGADSIYPQGNNIICRYDLSGAAFQLGDTLIITRALVNHESFPLSGLYLSDNIPPAFNVVSYTLKYNGNNIDHFYSGASQDSVIGYYDTYYWVVDDPNVPSISNILYPGDSIVMTIRITFSQGGLFSMPMHTTVFYGDQTGYFATDIALSVAVEAPDICGDVNSNGAINLLDATYLIKYLYKLGPPPYPLSKGDLDASGSVNILDVARLINYLYKNGPAPVCP